MSFIGLSIRQLQDLVRVKQASSQEIFDFFSKRLHQANPQLNVAITACSYVSNKANGLLQNIPVAVKDNFLTAGVRTTAGSQILDGYIPDYNATVIKKIIDTGALISCKTNLDAWMHGSSTETSDYGPCKNPWDVTRAPGGSSGGSAAAVAAGLAPIALGTETAGSIRQPAAWCGVVGLKPTYGLISRYGVIAMASSMDCPGPITHCVEDAALLLEVLAGSDHYDATTLDLKSYNYTQNLKKPRKYRIGLPASYFDKIDGEVGAAVEDMIKQLVNQGHRVVPVDLLSPHYAAAVYAVIQRSEVSSNLARYDGVRYGKLREFFGAEAKRRILTGVYSLAEGFSDKIYQRAAQVRAMIMRDYQQVFSKVDVIITPATPTPALKLGDYKSYAMFGEMMDLMNESSSVAGLPGISLPCGLSKAKLPIGVQLIANYQQEEILLNLAYQIEQMIQFKSRFNQELPWHRF